MSKRPSWRDATDDYEEGEVRERAVEQPPVARPKKKPAWQLEESDDEEGDRRRAGETSATVGC